MVINMWPFSKLFKREDESNEWYWTAYGKGAYAFRIGVAKECCPITYGTNEYWAWLDGWTEMKELLNQKGQIS